MVSKYGYSTVAGLEKYAIKDYSAIDATLTDTVLEDKITDAEKYVNGYIGTVFTGTIDDDIELVTNMIAKTMIQNYMIEEAIGSYSQANGITTPILANDDIVIILEKYRDLYSQKQGIFISKKVHVNPIHIRDPLRW
jgi:hypothetical protein